MLFLLRLGTEIIFIVYYNNYPSLYLIKETFIRILLRIKIFEVIFTYKIVDRFEGNNTISSKSGF